MSASALSPLRLTLLDGEEREFLLGYGAMKRMRELSQARKLNLDVQADDTDAMHMERASMLLFCALRGQHEYTFDDFEDLLPADPERIKDIVTQLMDRCGWTSRPTPAAAVMPRATKKKTS